MGFAAFLAAFAVAAGGNPSGITCNPGLQIHDGVTHLPALTVEISADVCGGLYLLSLPEAEREKVVKMNPSVIENYAMARGALVLAHEAQHTAGVISEGDAECRAFQLAPSLLARYLSGQKLQDVVIRLSGVHAGLPAEYRTVC